MSPKRQRHIDGGTPAVIAAQVRGIRGKRLNRVFSRIGSVFRRIIQDESILGLAFHAIVPPGRCQYWACTLECLSDDDTESIIRPLGCLTGPGELLNADLDVNEFFNNNDSLLNEFARLVKGDSFDPLLRHLREIKQLTGIEYGPMIALDARTQGSDQWTKSVCNETVLIIHEHEEKQNRMDIGCQQCERYKIRVTEGKRVTVLSVPFDKVDRFKGAVRLERHSAHKFLPYEVALSFAGEDRPYVRRVAEALRRAHIRVFYDEYEQASLWGSDLYAHLDEVYRKKARFCLLFVSRHYRSKVWTNHERQSAQARAFRERKSYILPVRLDDTDIPGIRPTVGYIDGRTIRPRELAALVQKKLFELE